MTYSPISGTPPQYQKRLDGTLASDYWLKFYQAGTATPLSAATGPSAVTLLAKIKLNDGGYPISNPLDNETVFIPYLNQDYKIVLFKSEADADANATGNADFVIDDVQLEIPVLATSDSAISARGTTQQALNDYDRSPLFVDGTDFTAGAPPHVVTAPAGWTPSATGMRFWKRASTGLVYELSVSGTSSTTFTVSESLLSTDTLFLGDDIVRNIHDGDAADIRTRLSVYSKAETYTQAEADAEFLNQTEADTRYLNDDTGTVDATNLAADSVTTVKIADNNVTNAKLVAPTAGDTYQLWRGTDTTTEFGTASTSYDDTLLVNSPDGISFAVTAPLAGVIRVKFDLRVFAGSGTASCRITKNGSLVSTQTNTSNTFVAKNVDVTVAAGDRVKIQFYEAGLNPPRWRNLRITSGADSLGIG